MEENRKEQLGRLEFIKLPVSFFRIITEILGPILNVRRHKKRLARDIFESYLFACRNSRVAAEESAICWEKIEASPAEHGSASVQRPDLVAARSHSPAGSTTIIEHFSDFAGQQRRCERFLEEMSARIKDAVVDDDVFGVTGHVQNLHSWIP